MKFGRAVVATLAVSTALGCSLLGYEAHDAQRLDGGTVAGRSPVDAGEDADLADASTALDGGLDARDARPFADASFADATVCRDQDSCDFACMPNRDCAYACFDTDKCHARCADKSNCAFACTDSDLCDYDCPPMASCLFRCTNADECRVHCANDSVCVTECVDSDCTHVTCDAKADCTLRCDDASDCAFMKCDQGTSCRGATQYCGGAHSCN